MEIIRENLHAMLTLERKSMEAANEHGDEGRSKFVGVFIGCF